MPAENNNSRQEVARRLREEALGVKLERSQFGTSRKVSSEQTEQIANLKHSKAYNSQVVNLGV